jgi:hypothetical protein
MGNGSCDPSDTITQHSWLILTYWWLSALTVTLVCQGGVGGDRVAGGDRGEQVLQWAWWGRVRPGVPVALQQCGWGQPGPDVSDRDRPAGIGVGLSIVDLLVVPPLSAAGRPVVRPACDAGGGWWVGDPGLPAEAECAADQGVVAADGGVRADLEVGPAQFVFDLFVALLDPGA